MSDKSIVKQIIKQFIGQIILGISCLLIYVLISIMGDPNNHEFLAEVLGVVFILVLTAYSLFHIAKYLYKKVYNIFACKVKVHSIRYNALIEINNKYSFNEVKCEYVLKKSVNSKAQFDRFKFNDYFEEMISKDIEKYLKLCKDTYANIDMYKKYEVELTNLPRFEKPTANPFSIMYSFAEKELCEKTTLKPVLSPLVRIKVSYTSQQGINHYEKTLRYNFSDICRHLNAAISHAKKRKEYLASKQYQRNLMTPSLRYDILKRDGFKCTICGRSVEDGVKLHVDHIFPVSKGGKTEKSNLRTLCNECNSGKSNKYEENGLN